MLNASTNGHKTGTDHAGTLFAPVSSKKRAIEATASIEMVSPQLASEWLTKNTHNRKLIDGRVDKLAANIAKKRWRVTNQGIGFDINGVLLDGQHRLSAIVKAGITVPLLVVRGLSADAMQVIDHDIKPRSVADLMTLNGVDRAARIAPLTRTIFLLYGNRVNFGFHEAMEIYQAFKPSLEWAAKKFVDPYNPTSRAPVIAAVAFAHRVFPRKVEDFATSLYRATGFTEGSPARALHFTLTRGDYRLGTETDRLDISLKTLRAAQLHCMGKTVSKLQSTRDGYLYFKTWLDKHNMEAK